VQRAATRLETGRVGVSPTMSATGSSAARAQAWCLELAQAALGSGGVGVDPAIVVEDAWAVARFDCLADREKEKPGARQDRRREGGCA
jgi:hypothetical protein